MVSHRDQGIVVRAVSFLRLVTLAFRVGAVVFLVVVVRDYFLVLDAYQVFIGVGDLELLIVHYTPLVGREDSVLGLYDARVLSRPVEHSCLSGEVLGAIDVQGNVKFWLVLVGPVFTFLSVFE